MGKPIRTVGSCPHQRFEVEQADGSTWALLVLVVVTGVNLVARVTPPARCPQALDARYPGHATLQGQPGRKYYPPGTSVQRPRQIQRAEVDGEFVCALTLMLENPGLCSWRDAGGLGGSAAVVSLRERVKNGSPVEFWDKSGYSRGLY